uniref:EOG090X0FH3 n=1 Tax=Daphnia similis TaxID=35528 RepID=A0A4Y7LUC7_9CRUS|nr:EOG090X0FH3 [Daphnia similis]SVE71364.1 EOG090X0FH3 [Daphnia similis]SVE71996.1 EOG090X0FH3 [Daphnia similis]SVE72623.1 EOG090X0FH3 [Daphnia similis]
MPLDISKRCDVGNRLVQLTGAECFSITDLFLILFEIGTYQISRYIGYCHIFFFGRCFVASTRALARRVSFKEVNVKDVSGRLVVACFLLNSLISASSLWAIVQRTKLCLDFSVTAFFLHLVASLIYNSGWPYSASWWVLQFSCVTITCVLAEFLCMRSEMKSIPLGMSARVDL